MARGLSFKNTGEQGYLLKQIMDHQIFHEEQFWVSVVLMNCLEEMMSEKMNGLSDRRSNKKREGEGDRENREMISIKTLSNKSNRDQWEQLVYNQLITYIQCMKNLELEKELINRVFTKIVYDFQLEKNYKINALAAFQLIDFNPNSDKNKNKMGILQVLLGRKKNK